MTLYKLRARTVRWLAIRAEKVGMKIERHGARIAFTASFYLGPKLALWLNRRKPHWLDENPRNRG